MPNSFHISERIASAGESARRLGGGDSERVSERGRFLEGTEPVDGREADSDLDICGFTDAEVFDCAGLAPADADALLESLANLADTPAFAGTAALGCEAEAYLPIVGRVEAFAAATVFDVDREVDTAECHNSCWSDESQNSTYSD